MASIALAPLTAADIPALGSLARAIWREHYVPIIGAEQVEYMLRAKYDAADLLPYIDAADRWLDVLRVEGELAGFLRCSRVSASELKLQEIYLAQAHRGTGLGRILLDRAEWRARRLGCDRISLYVNTRNKDTIQVYARIGYAIQDHVVIDIGGGFVMDDYVMAKNLAPV